MKFDVYKSAASSKEREREVGEQDFFAITETPYVRDCIARFRSGDANAKKMLPAWTPMGKTGTGKRRLEDMEPTGLVMLDIDHLLEEKKPQLMEVFNNMNTLAEWNVLLVHITPSGHGLRVIFVLPDDCRTIVEAQDKMVNMLGLRNYGDYDGACKDLTRLSFFPQASDIRYRSEGLFLDYEEQGKRLAEHLQTSLSGGDDAPRKASEDHSGLPDSGGTDGGQDQRTARSDFRYGEHLVRDIVTAYIKYRGEPEEGSTHNFYNDLVANFRHICNNDPDILIDVLPLFGQTRANRRSQCDSICRKNFSPKIPKNFYFWLKDNHFLPPGKGSGDDDADNVDDYQDERELLKRMPKLPPVFKEYIGIAPREFKIPTLFALLPVMGTQASYLQAPYFDGSMQTPSFISVISAEASQGKSFVNKFLETDINNSTPANLLHNLCQRDEVCAARHRLYAQKKTTKGSNEKSSLDPCVSLRITSPIISQSKMMKKMANNNGYHMFTFASEMDTFNKGARAAGGDKNDMYRVAWDNGVYSQEFMMEETWNGAVKLYLNVLITGTPAQCAKFFRNIENGLITRCSYTDLGMQDFAAYQPWKTLTEKDREVIECFKARCDANTYTEPLVYDRKKLYDYRKEKDFDDNVPWQYQFRERQTLELSWLYHPLDRWLEKQRLLALKDSDNARDMFRRRAALKAFRLAILCHALWPTVTDKERKIIKRFVLWFADLDLIKNLKRYSSSYNEFRARNSSLPVVKKAKFTTLLDALDDQFTKDDLVSLCQSFGVASTEYVITYHWIKDNMIEKIGKNLWKKVK